MKNGSITAVVAAILFVCFVPAASPGAEAARLDKDNWRLVPGGKEVDAIYGDLVMRNDKVVAVIASALPNRQLNLRHPQAQGCVADFALLEPAHDHDQDHDRDHHHGNDQLTIYHPHVATVTADRRPAADRVE